MSNLISNVTAEIMDAKVDILAEKSRRGLKPWKRFKDDALMVPDRGFRKQLKKLGEDFEIVWDSKACTWEIWEFPRDGTKYPYMVMRVGKAGSYEELSQKVLLQMKKNIYTHNNFTPKQICDYLEEYENQMERKREKRFRQKISDIALDTRAYGANVLQVQVPRSTKIRRAIENATG